MSQVKFWLSKSLTQFFPLESVASNDDVADADMGVANPAHRVGLYTTQKRMQLQFYQKAKQNNH